MTPYDIQKFAEALVPGEAPGQGAIRAVISDAITRWEARDRSGSEKKTFLPTADADLDQINSAEALELFRQTHGLRPDWHEPDNNAIDAYVIGDHLDNAMGPTVDHSHGEFEIVLCKELDFTMESGTILKPLAVVNVATLLGWATDGARDTKALQEAQAQR